MSNELFETNLKLHYTWKVFARIVGWGCLSTDDPCQVQLVPTNKHISSTKSFITLYFMQLLHQFINTYR